MSIIQEATQSLQQGAKEWELLDGPAEPQIQFTEREKELLKNETPIRIKAYGNLDQETAEAILVSYFINDPNVLGGDTTGDADKVVASGIRGEMFSTPMWRGYFDVVKDYYTEKRKRLTYDDASLLWMNAGLSRNDASMAKSSLTDCKAAFNVNRLSSELVIEFVLQHWAQKAGDSAYRRFKDDRMNPEIGPFKAVENFRSAVSCLEDPRKRASLMVRENATTGAHLPPDSAPLISGIIGKSEKMLIAGPSKSNKSWFAIRLALSVSRGLEWFGFQTVKSNVLYIDTELHDAKLYRRFHAVRQALRLPDPKPDEGLTIMRLRGREMDIESLSKLLLSEAIGFDLIIIDPIYALYGDLDENSATDMGALMGKLERVAQETGAAIVCVHHFAKGSAAGKAVLDRSSGSGVFGRSFDTVLTLTPHKDGGVTADFITRNYEPPERFVLKWQFPLHVLDHAADPNDLAEPSDRTPTPCADADIMALVPEGGVRKKSLIEAAAGAGLSRRQAEGGLARMVRNGQLVVESPPGKQAIVRRAKDEGKEVWDKIRGGDKEATDLP